MLKIEGKTVVATITRKDEDLVARIRFNRADDRLIIGDSNTALLDEVIDAVQDHINNLTEDLQVIRSGRNLD